jgi:hypothetical protein
MDFRTVKFQDSKFAKKFGDSWKTQYVGTFESLTSLDRFKVDDINLITMFIVRRMNLVIIWKQ